VLPVSSLMKKCRVRTGVSSLIYKTLHIIVIMTILQRDTGMRQKDTIAGREEEKYQYNRCLELQSRLSLRHCADRHEKGGSEGADSE
jgi:hypothetical protein